VKGDEAREVDHEQIDPWFDDPRADRLNVLVAAAGRRTSLVRAFVKEAHARGGRVLASDADPLAPALSIADEALRIPRTGDPSYIAALLEAVARYAIRLIVPTIDTDLPVLARTRAEFAALGCWIAVSSESFVAITLDKHQAGITFGSKGIRVPQSWLPPLDQVGDLPSRIIVKPRRGSASQDVYQVSREKFEAMFGLIVDPIVQEVLTGAEITIDALLDFEGRPIHYVPRRRIRTSGGESIQGVTLDHDPLLEDWIERVLELSSAMGALGPLTIQAFLTPSGPVLSEINPRFGGGFPLALAAGGAYPAWLLEMVAGRRIPPRLREYESGLYMTRHYVEQFTRHPKW
jgi:carbamoyl-phosphate synthase large subunit